MFPPPAKNRPQKLRPNSTDHSAVANTQRRPPSETHIREKPPRCTNGVVSRSLTDTLICRESEGPLEASVQAAQWLSRSLCAQSDNGSLSLHCSALSCSSLSLFQFFFSLLEGVEDTAFQFACPHQTPQLCEGGGSLLLHSSSHAWVAPENRLAPSVGLFGNWSHVGAWSDL